METNKIDLDKIRVSLAAAVGGKGFRDNFIPSGEVEGRLESFEKIMRQDLERHYLQVNLTDNPHNVPQWAVDVYGGYPWGWITNAIPADSDIISRFRRRVFLA